jgi:hypothetical protein
MSNRSTAAEMIQLHPDYTVSRTDGQHTTSNATFEERESSTHCSRR